MRGGAALCLFVGVAFATPLGAGAETDADGPVVQSPVIERATKRLERVVGDRSSASTGQQDIKPLMSPPNEFPVIPFTDPPVKFGMRGQRFIVPICVLQNDLDKTPHNELAEFHSYTFDFGKVTNHEEPNLLAEDYSEWAIMQQMAFERKRGNINASISNFIHICERNAARYKRDRTHERNEVFDDTNREISRTARPYWQSTYRRLIVFNRLACDVSFNDRRCSIDEQIIIKNEEPLFEDFKVCSLVFSDYHFSGWEAVYSFKPIVTDVSQDNPNGHVTGYSIHIRTEGTHDGLNKVGARVDLRDIGFTIVRKDASEENMKALGCNPRGTFSRVLIKKEPNGGPPRQCVDRYGQGYYCGGKLPGGGEPY